MRDTRQADAAIQRLIDSTLDRFVNMRVEPDLAYKIVCNLRECLSDIYLDDVKHFDFELLPTERDPSRVTLVPKNLFTFLLISGVKVHYDLVRDLDRWVTPEGVYRHLIQREGTKVGVVKTTHINEFTPSKVRIKPWLPDKTSNTRNGK